MLTRWTKLGLMALTTVILATANAAGGSAGPGIQPAGPRRLHH